MDMDSSSTSSKEEEASSSSSSSKATRKGFKFCIDRGGTFTDIYAEIPAEFQVGEWSGRHSVVCKLLSEDASYADAPREGIRRILAKVTGRHMAADKAVDSSLIADIRMGTTVATNALLERSGTNCALVTTRGFADILKIGNQSRPDIFDLRIERPDVLYSQVVELNERVRIRKWIAEESMVELAACKVVHTRSGDEVLIEREPAIDDIRAALQSVADSGIRSLAVCLLHAYAYPSHEELVARVAADMGVFANVSLSSELMACVRVVARGHTTCADAYLTPTINAYIQQFVAGFDAHFSENVTVSFMQSDGGLCRAHSFFGCRAVLSGPAAGVVAYARTTAGQLPTAPIVGFDMGGTSTDVSRIPAKKPKSHSLSDSELETGSFEAPDFELVFENVTAGVQIAAPQLDISTVAAGGGSRLFFEAGRFVTGPQSAAANPGPVCYRKGGPLAITDANLVLGRIVPSLFPHIFGAEHNEAIGYYDALVAMSALTEEVNAYNAKTHADSFVRKSVFEVAHGFVRVANETMCRPIRALTQSRGHDIGEHLLSCFGGAGGQHACAIARTLGIHKVFVHKYAGILSAYGMGLADVVHESQQPLTCLFAPRPLADVCIGEHLTDVCQNALDKLLADGLHQSTVTLKPFIYLRFDGTDKGLFVKVATDPICGKEAAVAIGSDGVVYLHDDAIGDLDSLCEELKNKFEERYKSEYGFVLERDIHVDYVRCRAVSSAAHLKPTPVARRPIDCPLKPEIDDWKAYFEFEDDSGSADDSDESNFVLRQVSTAVYKSDSLFAGDLIRGPALILADTSTIVVEANCTAQVTDFGDLVLSVAKNAPRKVTTALEPIQLSIFGHRFMSVAEEMGRVLQRTSVSTNIKERLDFSCAVFGPSGDLVANAPHLPVHLGSMQSAVRFQVKRRGDDIKRGDVLVSNHPVAGGTHLPDITVMTPVFAEGCESPCFWVASRGHHADIGGITPGSMPPFSTFLHEEGAAIESLKLVSEGKLREAEIVKVLTTASGPHPDCVGTRNLAHNLSDLKAQMAANTKGIELMQALIQEYSLEVVNAYMIHIQDNAEESVRHMLKQRQAKGCVLRARDYMDDGTAIAVRIAIADDGSALFDFGGSGAMVYGNCNAPKSVTHSAVIYCLRCLLATDIPLNQGCLKAIDIKIPKHSILDPAIDCAVVGGNVLTSQRVTDVILKAFGACAASQGCMNNVTFGDESFGYYETVAGGAGAGPHWRGASAVHTHMTNTRITDAEVLEQRYPVVLRAFAVRKHSGGKGLHPGGDGCVRVYQFCRPLLLSVLSERRCLRPFGLFGGGDAKTGLNLLQRKRDGAFMNLGAKRTYRVQTDDVFLLHTPGGGGYGKELSPEAPADECEDVETIDDSLLFWK